METFHPNPEILILGNSAFLVVTMPNVRLGHVHEFKSILQMLFMHPGYCLRYTEGKQTITIAGCAAGVTPLVTSKRAQIDTLSLTPEQGQKKNFRHWGTGKT